MRGDQTIAVAGSNVHSNSAEQTLHRLESMVSRVSVTLQQETIAEAVDVVIYLKLKGMRRFVEEVIAVEGYDTRQEK